MSVPTQTKVWILQNRPIAAVDLSAGGEATFALTVLDIPSPIPNDSLLVKPTWFSNDPAQRGWISVGPDPDKYYHEMIDQGAPMRGIAIAKVLTVGGAIDTYKKGDLVHTECNWAEYCVVKKAACTSVNPIPGTSPSALMGVFGISGLSAYWGLVEVLQMKPGESIIVSSAAGSVGNVLIQLARNVLGAKRIIAIVGSEDKKSYVCRLGADVALNYKSPTFREELVEATKEPPELFFDNVGGEIFDQVLPLMKRYGRIACCGAICMYNDVYGESPNCNIKNFPHIFLSRLTIKGFIVLDYLDRPEGLAALVKAYGEGKLSIEESLVEVPVEEMPYVWHRLFEGTNYGKLITKVV